MPRPLFPPVFAPTVSHPMVDDFTMRAARMRARNAPAGLPLVQELPLRNHPMWTGSNELGNEVGFAPDTNNTQLVLKLEEWGAPEFWTLCLGLEVPEEDLTVNGWDTTALIDFGAGGTMQRVEVDWLAGSSITLPMNAISVSARYNFEVGGEGGFQPPSSRLRLRATIGKGSSSQQRPTRSYKRVEEQSAFLIPPFAKQVYVNTTLSLPGITPFNFYSQTQSGNGFLVFTGDDTVIGAEPIAVYEYSQLVSYLDLINEVVGSPRPLPVPPYERYLTAVDAAGTALNPNNNISAVQFLIGI